MFFIGNLYIRSSNGRIIGPISQKRGGVFCFNREILIMQWQTKEAAKAKDRWE